MILNIFPSPSACAGGDFLCCFPARDTPPQIDFRGGLCYTGGQQFILFFHRYESEKIIWITRKIT